MENITAFSPVFNVSPTLKVGEDMNSNVYTHGYGTVLDELSNQDLIVDTESIPVASFYSPYEAQYVNFLWINLPE